MVMRNLFSRIVMGILVCLVVGGTVEGMKQQNQNVLSAIPKALNDNNTEKADDLINVWVTQGGDVNAKIHIIEDKETLEIPLLSIAILINIVSDKSFHNLRNHSTVG
jgi:hypothetical protein